MNATSLNSTTTVDTGMGGSSMLMMTTTSNEEYSSGDRPQYKTYYKKHRLTSGTRRLERVRDLVDEQDMMNDRESDEPDDNICHDLSYFENFGRAERQRLNQMRSVEDVGNSDTAVSSDESSKLTDKHSFIKRELI